MTYDQGRINNVLVTYGQHSKTLAVVRSIGRSGRRLIVTDEASPVLTSFSRYCARFRRTASPAKDQQNFLADLRRIVKDESVDLIIPMDDPECDMLCDANRACHLGADIAVASQDKYDVARNKYRTQELAAELGIGAPKSLLIDENHAASEVISALGIPVVIKPIRSSGSRGFRVLRHPSDVNVALEMREKYGQLLAQEYIPCQRSIGVSYLFNQGEMRASFTHRRLMEFPETGGPSIVRESITHPEAESAGRRILEAIGWHGVAMAEFRVDSRDGKPKLLEINPRFWGSLPLAVASGVDFPRLLLEMYEQGDVAAPASYLTGVRCVKLLPSGAVSVVGRGGLKRASALAKYALRARCFDVESFEDPLPAIGAVLFLARYSLDPEKTAYSLKRDH